MSEITTRPMTAEDWPYVSKIYLEGIATEHATFQTTCPPYTAWDASHTKDCRLVVLDEAFSKMDAEKVAGTHCPRLPWPLAGYIFDGAPLQRGRADGIQKIISHTSKNTTVHVLTHSGIFYLYCIFTLQVIPHIYRTTAREPMGSQGSRAMGSAS